MLVFLVRVEGRLTLGPGILIEDQFGKRSDMVPLVQLESRIRKETRVIVVPGSSLPPQNG